MIIDQTTEVSKPFTKKCYHYFSNKKYVGAVWLNSENRWDVFCCASKDKYAHLGDFDSLEHAEACLKNEIKDI